MQQDIVYPLSNKVKGVVLVVHGLNATSKIMYSISNQFLKKDYVIKYLTLTGHDSYNKNSFNDFLKVTPSNWVNDVYKVTKELKENFSPLPIVYVGYSLGGLVGVSYILQRNDFKFSEIHLFAPALSIAWYTKFLKVLKPLQSLDIALRGLTPLEYRAHKLTPLKAYNSLSLLLNYLYSNKCDLKKLNQLKCFLYYHPKDELVSAYGLKKLVKDNKLSNWTLVKCSFSLKIKHLFVITRYLNKKDKDSFLNLILNNIS